ncbi:MAG: hypothetical protein A2175_01355 [Candidatus Nealsonbacteria bacterium RBG_13_42_11]|uniref:Methyltransferase type 11 domain-containing protein n=1 Tax=Candidatus Nealsonbacteria bacterium RBG_13_42_11 TaxID=1801663 RepID=A0A1G2DZP2_9BACT|nr:MAG: hypothetical protein A2175_01355 [Candidatus Nealsonbacteria bacterium RBG_13_42_11]
MIEPNMSKTEYNSRIYPLFQVKDKNLFEKVSQYLRPKPEDKILEIGCGRGFLTKEMQKIAPGTIGIDINIKAIESGVAKNLKVIDATNMGFPADFFDKIYSCHTIEHIKEISKFFKEIEKVLKPGGRALLVYPFEIIRGTGAINASLLMFGDIIHCRKIHLHKFSPKKIQKIIRGTKLRHIKSHFSLLLTPQYFTLLEKI